MTKKRPTLLVRGLTVRGARSLAKGRYDQALADFDRAIELSPADARCFLGRGETYRKMERCDDALADFDRAIELDPTEDEFAAARAEICQLKGRSDTDDASPSNRGTTAT